MSNGWGDGGATQWRRSGEQACPDSPHVRAATRALNRLETVGEYRFPKGAVEREALTGSRADQICVRRLVVQDDPNELAALSQLVGADQLPAPLSERIAG
jgi:hypothetical protein